MATPANDGAIASSSTSPQSMTHHHHSHHADSTHVNYIELIPHVHQVGGHGSMWEAGPYVCKRSTEHEVNIYRELKLRATSDFIPEFYGSVQAKMVSVYDNNSYVNNGNAASSSIPASIKLELDASADLELSQPVLDILATCQHVHDMGSSSSSNYSGSDDDTYHDDVEQKTTKMKINKHEKRRQQERKSHHRHSFNHMDETQNRDDDMQVIHTTSANRRSVEQLPTYRLQNSPTETHNVNPWSKTLFHKTTRRSSAAGFSQFLVLENLTNDYVNPCVLDLKLGTRTYADWATREKREKMIKRVEQSTSKDLGVRLGGMQVFNRVEHEYMCWDKLAGRAMDMECLLDAFRVFVESMPTGIIQTLLARLQQLRDCLMNEHEFRFYSSSLLLVYDASATRQVDVRIIDFANTSFTPLASQQQMGEEKQTSCDTSFLFGLENTIRMLRHVQMSSSTVM